MKYIRFLGTLLACFSLFASTSFGAELPERQLIIRNHAEVDAYCAYTYVVTEEIANLTGESIGYHVKGWVHIPSDRSESVRYNSKFMPFIYFILENDLEIFEEDNNLYPPSVHYVPAQLLDAIRAGRKPIENQFEIVQRLNTGRITSISGADQFDLRQVTFYSRKNVLIPGPVETVEIVEPQRPNDDADIPAMREFDSVYDRAGFVREGKDHALLFATNTYQHWADLETPIRDAEAIAVELLLKYGFTVNLQRNMTILDISKTLVAYAAKSYEPGDQLLIYFAGYGVFHEILKEGYIAGTDSISPDVPGYQHSYLSHSELKSNLDKLGCERVLLVLDLSYGRMFDDNTVLSSKTFPTIAKNRLIKVDTPTNSSRGSLDLAETLKVKTRWYLSSGGKERIYDDSVVHSPFASSFLSVLRNGAGKDGILTIPEIERQLPSKLQAELDRFKATWRNKDPLWDGGIQQTPESGPFGSGKPSEKAFVFIKSQK